MEFRIYMPTETQMGFGHYPSELATSEKIELIKQLCPEIERIAQNWHGVAKVLNMDSKFTTYLAEQMEKEL